MENEKKRTVMADKKNKSKKIKYRKKKKPVAVKSLAASNATQKVLKNSNPKQGIARAPAAEVRNQDTIKNHNEYENHRTSFWQRIMAFLGIKRNN